MSGSSSNTAKIERNLKEKHRRSYFKDLFARLASLLPPLTFRCSLLDLIDRATEYIRQSKERVAMLRTRLQHLSEKEHNLPEISVLSSLSNELEVNFRVSEWNKSIILQEVIHVIEEGGAEVTSLTYSAVGGQFLGTIRSKAIYARIGIEISNVEERLRQLSSRYN